MIDVKQPSNTFSADEFRQQIGLLNKEDWDLIGLSAKTLAQGFPITHKELMQEAFCRALEGVRNCPRSLPIPVFIYGVMRSLISDHLKKQEHDLLHNSSPLDETTEQHSLSHEMDTPEAILIASQTLDAIYKAFSGDEVAEMIFMGADDGYTPLEIQETLGISATEYASALKAIRRKIIKLVN